MVWVMGREVRTLPIDQDNDLNRILQGMGGLTKTRKPKTRHPLQEADLKKITQWLRAQGETEIADGVEVQYGCLARPRDVGELSVARVDTVRWEVVVRAKRWRCRVPAQGEFETHPVVGDQARKILARRKKKARKSGPGTLLFPAWKAATASRWVKRAAEATGLPKDCTGAHCVRHGRAADVAERVRREVCRMGAWASKLSADRYGKSRAARNAEAEEPKRKKRRKNK